MTEPVMVGGAPVEAGNKRAFVMLGAAAVVAVLVLVLPKLLFGGGSEAADDPEVPTVAVPAGGAGARPALDGDEALVDAARTFEVFSTKNPFTPLIDTTPAPAIAPVLPGAVAAPVVGAPAPVAPALGVPAPVAPALGTPAPAPVFGAPTPAPAPAPAPGIPAPATEPRRGQRVALLDVFVDAGGVTVGSIRVNDTVHEVAVGTTFATSYKVLTLSVAEGCAELLSGSDRFRLCEGEELLK